MSQHSSIVLMYHGIINDSTDIPQGREVGADIYDVRLDEFKRQMELLKKENYKCVLWEDKKGLEEKIVLTFDDGEMNNARLAVPLLKELGFQAYFFVITKRIGKPGYMGLEDLKQLQKLGMVVGSHGFSHEILTNLLDSQIEQEFIASKKFLERNLEFSIDTVSIPRGFCNEKIINMAYGAGYKNVFISDRPQDLQAPCISRVAVKNHWTLKRFEAAIKGEKPFREKLGEGLKKGTKFVFRDAGYNFVRNILIKIFR